MNGRGLTQDRSDRSDIRVARMRLIFEQIRSGGDRNFGYLLGDREARSGVLIDPSYAPEVFVERARAQGLTITHVINTHSHPDHTNGNDRALALTGAVLAAHPLMQPESSAGRWPEPGIGELRLTAHHVPGHCPDHLVLYESVHSPAHHRRPAVCRQGRRHRKR